MGKLHYIRERTQTYETAGDYNQELDVKAEELAQVQRFLQLSPKQQDEMLYSMDDPLRTFQRMVYETNKAFRAIDKRWRFTEQYVSLLQLRS
jgi:hypothetical protein